MKEKIFYLLLASLIIHFPQDSHALKPYRCAGRVQFVPCTSAQKADAIEQRKAMLRPSSGIRRGAKGSYALVKKPSFTRASGSDGIWRGIVKGNGQVHLHLLLSQGRKTVKRFIGAIELLKGKETTFTFRSVAPKGAVGQNWRWRVIASAFPLA